jgi:hypothetical protein
MAQSILFDIADSPAAAQQTRIRFALDDTPSKRYGPHVEGAGVHHNPTGCRRASPDDFQWNLAFLGLNVIALLLPG